MSERLTAVAVAVAVVVIVAWWRAVSSPTWLVTVHPDAADWSRL